MGVVSVLFAAALSFAPQSTEVVVPHDARKNQRVVFFAAQEMTNFLSRAFGSAVPIVHAVDPAKTSIVLGSNAWSRAAGIDTTRLPQDGFAMRTKGNAVYIAGVDANSNPRHNHGCYARATLFGVYEFLEKYVGCRFYFPGELGEIVPSVRSVCVPESDYVSAPAFVERNFSPGVGEWYDGSGGRNSKNFPLSELRLRMQTRPVPCCHGLRGFKYVKRFGATHPEYFQMKKDGTRKILDTGKEPHWKNNKFCFSSVGLREEIYQDVKAYLTGQLPASRGLEKWDVNCRHGEFVDIMPEDGTVHCECSLCREAYAKADDPKSESNEQIWGYTIDIAERLKREGVKGYVTQMAYGAYHNVPGRKVPDNVIVTVCNNGGWVRPERAQADSELVRRWADNVGKVKLYNNCGKFACANLDLADVPTLTPRAMAAFYNRMAPMARGAYCSNHADRALYSTINWYVFSRVAWYGSVDIDALLDEYYRLMFGAGAKPMQAFFEELERKWMEEVLGNSVDTPIGTVNMAPSEYRVWTDLYSPAKLKPLAALVDRATAAVPADSLEAKRIALMRREILDPMVRHATDYNANLSVLREKARRASAGTHSLVKFEKPVTITVDSSMTNRPAKCVSLRADLKPGCRYRLSYFVKGENLMPYRRRGGAQAVVWFDQGADRAMVLPDVGLEGTFDWLHQSAEFAIPKESDGTRKTKIDLRVFFAIGTAYFDGLVIELCGA